MKTLSIPDYILYNKNLSSNDKLIMAYLLTYRSNVVIVSNGRISKELGIPLRTVARSLEWLQELLLITINNDKTLNGSYKSRKIMLINQDRVLLNRILDIKKGKTL